MAQLTRMRYSNNDQYQGDWARPRASVSHSVARRDWFFEKGDNPLPAPKIFLQIVKSPEPLPINEASFAKLSESWRKETAMLSSLTKKVIHPAYQRIIGMGPAAIPLILKEMKLRPGHWFWALDAITQGENPASECETLSDATKAWIAWGEAKGIL